MAKQILVLGSGGREHAITWHLNKTGYRVHCSPGSDAISKFAECWSFDSFEGLLQQLKAKSIRDVIVGPEALLEEGIADFLEDRDISCFGPTQKAAKLETDKAFSKTFCNEFGIRTPQAEIIKFEHQIEESLDRFKPPYVVKAAGLAAGKGVWLGSDKAEAQQVAQSFLKKHYNVLIEEFVEGQELSCFFMIDGENSLYLGACQDHKRLLDNDEGPNTGGMGAYSPPPLMTAELKTRIEKEVLENVLKGLNQRNLDYKGFLFIGLMVSKEDLHVIEFNCRLGDPETQSLLMRLKSPLPQLIEALSKGTTAKAELSDEVSLSVVISAEGYPTKPLTDFEIPLLDQVPPSIQVFHAGTQIQDGRWIAKGGRLFSLNIADTSLESCQETVYKFLENQKNKTKLHYRNDIGAKALLVKE